MRVVPRALRRGSTTGRSIFFPPALTLARGASTRCATGRTSCVGVQNIHWEDKGAFTGETRRAMARDAGARVVLVGHSERRHVFGETDEETAQKCAAVVRARPRRRCCASARSSRSASAARPRPWCCGSCAPGFASSTPAQVARRARSPTSRCGRSARDDRDARGCVRDARRDPRGAASRWSATARDAIPILYGGSVNRQRRRAARRARTWTACSSAARASTPTVGRRSASA